MFSVAKSPSGLAWYVLETTGDVEAHRDTSGSRRGALCIADGLRDGSLVYDPEKGHTVPKQPEGAGTMRFETYAEAKADAQSRADAFLRGGMKRAQSEMGVECLPTPLDPRKPWRVFGPLPSAKNRQGHELRCEAVYPLIDDVELDPLAAMLAELDRRVG